MNSFYLQAVRCRRLASCGLCLLVAGVLLAPLAVRGAETDFFERHELYIDGPIEDILIGDADGDGLKDIFVFYRLPVEEGNHHQVAFFHQNRRDHFRNTLKQSWGLPERGGFFDLADVTGDSLRELVALGGSTIYYYPLRGTSYDPVIEHLFSLDVAPHIPFGAVRTWDFCWPLIEGRGEVVVLPWSDFLELWMPDSQGVYAPADSLWCRTIVNQPVSRQFRAENQAAGVPGIAYCLPSPAPPVSSASAEVFLTSSTGVKGFRRNDLSELDFAEGAQILCENSMAPFFSRGPFGSGIWVDDINGDGSSDLIHWQAQGGITQARMEVDIHYGPITEKRQLTPHQHLTADNIVAYPQLADLDHDGRKEIILCAVELGTITSAKMIVVKNVNVYLLVYRQRPDNSFGEDPDARSKVSCRLDTDSPDILSRVPIRFADDLNADGLADFIACPGGDELEVYLGQEGRLLPKDAMLTIDCDSPEAVYPVDLDHNRKTDLVVLHRTKPSHVHKVTVFITR